MWFSALDIVLGGFQITIKHIWKDDKKPQLPLLFCPQQPREPLDRLLPAEPQRRLRRRRRRQLGRVLRRGPRLPGITTIA